MNNRNSLQKDIQFGLASETVVLERLERHFGEVIIKSKHKFAKYDGKGILTELDGSQYNGEWSDGKKNGNAIVTLSNGSQLIEVWDKGKFISSQSL